MLIYTLGLPLYAQQAESVIIDGMYATSTALPYGEFTVTKILDNDASTYWKTLPGAGPDEGIMIYFQKPTYLTGIKVNFASGSNLSEVEFIEVYGDGRSFWGGKNIEEELSSLYIRIASVKNTNISRSVIDGKDYWRESFSIEKSVGISELQLLGVDEKPLKIVAPEYIKGKINTSTNLKPALAYGGDNLMDGRKEFGWAEGAKGVGVGETVTFSFEEEVEIDRLKLWNGYQRSPSHFSGNGRVKTFSFGLKGQTPVDYSVKDSQQPEEINLASPVKGREFILTIKDIYRGTKYEDLVISEIHFMNEDQSIILQSDVIENRVKMQRALASNLLKQFLDRNISANFNGSEEDGTKSVYYNENSSMIIRSNNTFVIYQTKSTSIEEYDEEEDYYDESVDKTETISDGNWELVEEQDDFVKIRIFGKIFTPTTSAELYKGDVTSSNVKIFQDFLTLRKDKISGQRFIDDIIIK